MKTIKLKTTALALATVLLTTCGSNDNNNGITTPIKKRLVKTERIYNGNQAAKKTYAITYNNNVLKTYQISGKVNTDNISLTYNASNKITKQSLSSGYEYIYTYNSQGNLEKIFLDHNDGYSSSLTFIYNNDNTIKQCISKKFDNGTETQSDTKNFSYENGFLKSIAYNYSNGYYRERFEYDTNENLIVAIYESGSNDGITFDKSTRYKITYDDKINPSYEILKNANILNKGGWSVYSILSSKTAYFNPVHRNSLGNETSGLILKFYSKNNVISSDFDYGIESRDYTYNDANLPTRLIENRVINTRPRRKYKYQYNYFYEE